MRIVFFTHYYPPEVNAPASRISEHCRAWVKAGHNVTVVTSAPSHPLGIVYPGYKNKLFQREVIDGVIVMRVWTYLAANQDFGLRTLNYLSFLLSSAMALLHIRRPDVFISTSPQFFCGLSGLIAKTLRRVPWVLEVRDLWPESIVTVGAMREGAIIRLLEGLERLSYRQADHVVAVTQSFVSHIAARCQGPEKISVVKNGADLSFFVRGQDGATVKRRFGLEGRFVAAYVGTHGMAHGLDTVLEAAQLLRNDTRIGFLMVGDGAERARLEARRQKLKLDNVHFACQLPKSEMPAIWAATDASMVLLRKSDTFTKVLPSKLFEAMAMECPVVLGVEGEARELLEDAGAGIAIAPQNAEELAAAVVRLAEDADFARQLGQQGSAYVRAHHDRAVLAASYLDILEGVISQRPGSLDAETEGERAP